MIDRDKVTTLLENYRSYKFAIRNFENTGWVAISGTGYSDMGLSRGGGFGPKAPVKFACDSIQDLMDYQSYKSAVKAVDEAIETLTDEEQSVVKLKWMDGMTLWQIAERKSYSERTIKRYHRVALKKLAICLRFVEIPDIEQVPMTVA